jgi:hypothetical protein
MIFTNPGGPEVEDIGSANSVKFLRKLFSEFCFKENDQQRALSVAISAMLTLFVFNIIPKGALRPGFYTANAEARENAPRQIGDRSTHGTHTDNPLPEQEEEIQKLVFSTAIAGSPSSSLIMRHVSSGRSRADDGPTSRAASGCSQNDVENMMTVFFTAMEQ